MIAIAAADATVWVAALGALSTVTVAVIAAMVQLRRLRRENSAQHAVNIALLERIGEDVVEVKADVRRVSDRLDTHLEQHRREHP